MKKIKKIKIKVNGKSRVINEGTRVIDLISNLKIPIKKVAIELNNEILDKKKLNKINIKKMIILKLFILLGVDKIEKR